MHHLAQRPDRSLSTPYRKPATARALAAVLSLGLVVACVETKPNMPEVSESPQTRPPAEAPPTGDTRLRTVYVPAYSHLPLRTKPHRTLLSILLSIRNVDSRAVVTLTHVDYFDTSGNLVRRYLDSPRKLDPLETAEFAVDVSDEAGGSGANFLVYWEGPSDAHALLTETVMWGHLGAGHIGFTTRGVELERRPDPSIFDPEESHEPE